MTDSDPGLSSSASSQAMTGIKVLELGTTIAGPFCARLLADFGAEVIKVESAEGDPARLSGKKFKDKPLYAASLMRNKRLIVIDLRQPEGQELVKELVKRVDVLVENFRPGTLEKWQLGYDVLSQINPGLIMVRVSGYGQSGPYSQRPGYGVVCEAVGGLRHVTGDPDRPPARANIGLTDCITGLYAAFGTMMALRHRDRTGCGQVVDTALYECAFSFMDAHVAAYEKTGYIVGREGAGHSGSVVNNLYQTRDGEYVHIQGSQTNSFRRLCLAMGRPDILNDPRFNNRPGRVQNAEAMDGIVQEWVGARSYDEVERSLAKEDVVFTRIYTMADIFCDPHFKARGMIVDTPDDDLGTMATVAPVPRLSLTPGVVRRTGGAVARDTDAVLRDELGLDERALAALAGKGVIKRSH